MGTSTLSGWAGAGIVIAVQPNGERIRIETWIYECWIRRCINDPEVTRFLNRAVLIVFGW